MATTVFIVKQYYQYTMKTVVGQSYLMHDLKCIANKMLKPIEIFWKMKKKKVCDILCCMEEHLIFKYLFTTIKFCEVSGNLLVNCQIFLWENKFLLINYLYLSKVTYI